MPVIINDFEIVADAPAPAPAPGAPPGEAPPGPASAVRPADIAETAAHLRARAARLRAT